MAEDSLNKLADQNEMSAYWMFKKSLGLEVQKLDNNQTGKRPDFYVFRENEKDGFICEVKSILSAGAGISILKTEGLPSSDPFQYDPWPKFWSVLSDAIAQYRELVASTPSFRNFPFVIGLFFEFYADIWSRIPRDLKEYPLVSALIRIERSREQSSLFETMSAAELRDIIEGRSTVSIHPDTKKWAVLRNSSASNPISLKWFGQCFEE